MRTIARKDGTQSVVAQRQALKLKVRRRVTSPFVIGGLLTIAAAVGYFAVRRSARSLAPSSRPAVRGNLKNVVKTEQVLLPLPGALGATTATLERSQRAFALIMPKPEGIAQKQAVVAPWAMLSQGSWLSRQWQMIKATAKAWVDDNAPSMGAALSY